MNGRIALISAASWVLALAAPSAHAATYGELNTGSNGMVSGYSYPSSFGSAGPYASSPSAMCPPYCVPVKGYNSYGGPEGNIPGRPDYRSTPYIPPYQANPRGYLPIGPWGDEPNAQIQLWSFGQTNSVSDPYNTLGLSTPFMFVPWSTPLSGWTNAQTWNWWRERSGALPRNW